MSKRRFDPDQELRDIKARDREEKRAQEARDAEKQRHDRELQRITEAIDAMRRGPSPLGDETADEAWLDRMTELRDALTDAGKPDLLTRLPSRGNARRFTRRCVELLAAGKRRQAIALLNDIGKGKLDAELARERNAELPDDLCRLLDLPIPQPPPCHPPKTVNGDHRDGAEPPSQRKQEILQAVLLLNAETPRSSVSRRKAAQKADRSCKVNSYNGTIASLVHDGLLQSKKGPGGGIWLTVKGKSLAESLASSRRE